MIWTGAPPPLVSTPKETYVRMHVFSPIGHEAAHLGEGAGFDDRVVIHMSRWGVPRTPLPTFWRGVRTTPPHLARHQSLGVLANWIFFQESNPSLRDQLDEVGFKAGVSSRLLPIRLCELRCHLSLPRQMVGVPGQWSSSCLLVVLDFLGFYSFKRAPLNQMSCPEYLDCNIKS